MRKVVELVSTSASVPVRLHPISISWTISKESLGCRDGVCLMKVVFVNILPLICKTHLGRGAKFFLRS